jgi:hypothetical protein
LAAAVEEALVVAHDILVEHGDIAPDLSEDSNGRVGPTLLPVLNLHEPGVEDDPLSGWVIAGAVGVAVAGATYVAGETTVAVLAKMAAREATNACRQTASAVWCVRT